LGSELDTLILYLLPEIQQGEILEKGWLYFSSNRDPFINSLPPILEQSYCIHTSNKKKITERISSLLMEASYCKVSLQQYMNINIQLHNELNSIEQCTELANSKYVVAKLEQEMVKRLSSLLDGTTPYNESDVTWESIIKFSLKGKTEIQKTNGQTSLPKTDDIRKTSDSESSENEKEVNEKELNNEGQSNKIKKTTPTKQDNPMSLSTQGTTSEPGITNRKLQNDSDNNTISKQDMANRKRKRESENYKIQTKHDQVEDNNDEKHLSNRKPCSTSKKKKQHASSSSTDSTPPSVITHYCSSSSSLSYSFASPSINNTRPSASPPDVPKQEMPNNAKNLKKYISQEDIFLRSSQKTNLEISEDVNLRISEYDLGDFPLNGRNFYRDSQDLQDEIGTTNK